MWVFLIIILQSELTEGLVLPYDVIYPAKLLFGMWNKWYQDSWFGSKDSLREGQRCVVSEEATLQWAYFKSLNPIPKQIIFDTTKPYWNEDERKYPIIVHIATHFKFFKTKMYPFLPRTSHFRFCEYDVEKGPTLVCDSRKGLCVKCKNIGEGSPILYEACNLQQPTADELPKVQIPGVVLYKSVKMWTRKITVWWKMTEGEACNATGKQTLALTRMRKLLPLEMKNGRDARTRREWVTEWDTIDNTFSDNVIAIRKMLDGFDDIDAEQSVVYCSPSGDDGANYTIDGDDKLVCDGSTCVTCRKSPPPKHGDEIYKFPPGPLNDACKELGVDLRTSTTTRRTTTTTTTRRTKTTTKRWGWPARAK